jgi:hypothetical protein
MFSKEMKLPSEITEASYSKEELVLPYIFAMDLLDYIKDKNISIVAWEGWILYQNKKLGHSESHQGTVDISNLSQSSAIALAHSTIMQAHEIWESNPEVENGELLYCLTLST